MNKKFIKPNFKNNIINISATLAEFLGCPNNKPTLPILKEDEINKPCASIVCKITKQEYKNNPMYQDFQIKITKDVLEKGKKLWTL